MSKCLVDLPIELLDMIVHFVRRDEDAIKFATCCKLLHSEVYMKHIRFFRFRIITMMKSEINRCELLEGQIFHRKVNGDSEKKPKYENSLSTDQKYLFDGLKKIESFVTETKQHLDAQNEQYQCHENWNRFLDGCVKEMDKKTVDDLTNLFHRAKLTSVSSITAGDFRSNYYATIKIDHMEISFSGYDERDGFKNTNWNLNADMGLLAYMCWSGDCFMDEDALEQLKKRLDIKDIPSTTVIRCLLFMLPWHGLFSNTFKQWERGYLVQRAETDDIAPIRKKKKKAKKL